MPRWRGVELGYAPDRQSAWFTCVDKHMGSNHGGGKCWRGFGEHAGRLKQRCFFWRNRQLTDHRQKRDKRSLLLAAPLG